jgi:CHASE3 domain sensor protein
MGRAKNSTGTRLETSNATAMRAMFTVYMLVIIAGILLYVVVGLLHL